MVAVYGGVGGYGFIDYDDDVYVTRNPLVTAGLTGRYLAGAFTSRVADNWHPLTWLSHMADVSLFGLEPGAFHLVNLGLHCATSLLALLAFLLLTGRWGPSLLGAALFALHPLRVESVVWIAERKDLLAGFFWVLSLVAYRRYAAGPSPPRMGAVALAMAASLLAKPMAVTLPVALLVLDRWPLHRLRRAGDFPSLAWEKAPLLLLSLISSLVTLGVQAAGESLKSAADYPPAARLENAVHSVGLYLADTLWPSGLAVFYPHPKGTLAAGAVLTSLVLLAAVAAAAWRLRSRQPHLLAGLLLFLGMLAPVSGLVQTGLQARADRYTYLPHLGIFLAAAWTLHRSPLRTRRDKVVLVGLALAVLLALAGATRLQVGYWRDTETLFRHALAVTRGNYVAHGVLGYSLYHQGRLREALDQFAASYRLDPGNEAVRWHLLRYRSIYPFPGPMDGREAPP
jgi:hypothetical protein